MKPGYAIVMGLGLLGLTSGIVAAQPVNDSRAAAEPVMQQLEAFRRDDYLAAYAFACEQIQRLFDPGAFEQMVKRAYPEIAHSTVALVAESEVAPNGHADLRVKDPRRQRQGDTISVQSSISDAGVSSFLLHPALRRVADDSSQLPRRPLGTYIDVLEKEGASLGKCYMSHLGLCPAP